MYFPVLEWTVRDSSSERICCGTWKCSDAWCWAVGSLVLDTLKDPTAFIFSVSKSHFGRLGRNFSPNNSASGPCGNLKVLRTGASGQYGIFSQCQQLTDEEKEAELVTWITFSHFCYIAYIYIYTYIHTHTHTHTHIYRVFNCTGLHILIWVIYLLRFTTCYITQLTCIYSKCWKWCPFISVHLSTHFTMFLATFLSVLSFEPVSRNFLIIFAIALFTGACLLNFSKKLYLQWA